MPHGARDTAQRKVLSIMCKALTRSLAYVKLFSGVCVCVCVWWCCFQVCAGTLFICTVSTVFPSVDLCKVCKPPLCQIFYFLIRSSYDDNVKL